ncbi:MAG: hypothetical protein GEEBNDBF_02582 [bacterium]|nr:hypothetical protein [bacterium]
MAWRGPVIATLLLLCALTLALFSDFLPTPSRTDPPPVTRRFLLHQEPTGAQAICATSGLGSQLLVAGEDAWVLFSLSGPSGSSIWITHSADGGQTFAQAIEASALIARQRVIHGSLTRDPADGVLFLALVAVPDQMPPGSTGTTSMALLRSDDAGAAWSRACPDLIATPGQSLSLPLPVVLGPGQVAVLLQETQERTRDHLRCWRALPAGDQPAALLPVDDDPTGASKGAFSAGVTGDWLYVAYTDGRRFPDRGLFLYVTRAPLATLAFEPSRMLDQPQERFWQAEPQLTVGPSGEVSIAATQAVVRFQSAAWRDKLKRHKIAGLHEINAWSREPVLWRLRPDGSWDSEGDFNDHQTESRAHSVMLARQGPTRLLAWSESRPVAAAPDLRFVLLTSRSQRPTRTSFLNLGDGDTGMELLLGLAASPDGGWLALYRDATEGRPDAHELILAHIAPPTTP